MKKVNKTNTAQDFKLSPEWGFYLFFLFCLALVYIYLSHRTDNIVRDIETSKQNLIELRAENVTLKSDVMRYRLRQNLEERLEDKGIKEPNKPITIIKSNNGE
ncbi:FtsL-like putative cell division protein [Bacteroidia bacterium]|nr:FtsL-like putative cell division protein [Bacteroidia bacterium]